jgi:hypothetical protein
MMDIRLENYGAVVRRTSNAHMGSRRWDKPVSSSSRVVENLDRLDRHLSPPMGPYRLVVQVVANSYY